MASSPKEPPRNDEGDKCPHCSPCINYYKTIQRFDKNVISRIKAHSNPPSTQKRSLNYAILRLHQEAVWMKLGLYPGPSSTKSCRFIRPPAVAGINILIDTGAALSLIKEEIVIAWKEQYPENIQIQETTQKAETCSGNQLQISHKCTVSGCHLSGGPSLTLEFFACKNLFCDAILGLPEMRARHSSIDLRSFVFRYALSVQDPGYGKKTMAKGVTSPMIPRLQDSLKMAPLGHITIPCIGYWNMHIRPSQLRVNEYNLIPIQTIVKGRACYVKVLNPSSNSIKVNPKRISLSIQPASKIATKTNLKKSKNWCNTTLEEYSDFIFAHGRYNNLDNLDSRIREAIRTPNWGEETQVSESSSHPFSKKTPPGTLLVGLLMEIYRSTYHCGAPIDTLLSRAANLPAIMRDASTQGKKGVAVWFFPTLKSIRDNHSKANIQHLYVKVPQQLCRLGINLLHRLALAEPHSSSGLSNRNLEAVLSQKAHCGFYQLSLLWALTGACLEELTYQYDMNLHPFFKLELQTDVTPQPSSSTPKDRKDIWKKIIEAPTINTVSKSSLATPIEQILSLSPSEENYSRQGQEEESLEAHKSRILNKHQKMVRAAKEEYEAPNEYEQVKGKAINHLRPDELPKLAQYAASPKGMVDYHKSQVENNLARLLEGFSQAQLVMYSSIEDIERDLIPPPIWPYFRTYCTIMEDPDFLKETKDVPQIGLPPLSAWDRLETSPSPLKNAQGLPLPRILALATINMLRDGANEIYLEECRMLRYELYALCVLYWEAFSLHSKHWGWIMARYFQVETLLSNARPEVSVHHRANSTYSKEAFEMVKRELTTRVSRGRYVVIHGSPFLSSMTAIPKGDSMPNRSVISRDPEDPAIKALKELPPDRVRQLQEIDHKLQDLQDKSCPNSQDRSVTRIISLARGRQLSFNEEVAVSLYGESGPILESGKAPLGVRLFPISQPPEIPLKKVALNLFPECFEEPLDEEIFTTLSWIAGIGSESKRPLLQRSNTHEVALKALQNLPTIRANVLPLKYKVKMVPTTSSRRYSPNGSFLTTAQALNTMKSLIHNFKAGPNLVAEGDPEYALLKQDSSNPRLNSVTLREVSQTPLMHSLNLHRESIAKSVLQDLSSRICGLTTTRSTPEPKEPGFSLSSVCRPMLKSTDSKSLLALAKSLVSLQRTLQGKPALRRDTVYINLMDKFRSALLRTLGEDNIPTYDPKDPLVEDKDRELIRIGFGGDQRDSCFTSLAESLGKPIWVFEGRIIQTQGQGVSFEEEHAKLYMPKGEPSIALAIFFSPRTLEFFKAAMTDAQGLEFLTASRDQEHEDSWGPWILDRQQLQKLLATKAQFVSDKLNTLPKMKNSSILGGRYYMKHTAARYITHGSMANSCAEQIATDMPSPALCAQSVHRGYRHSGFDFTSQYEQIPASAATSLLHTIGFDGKEYSPLSAPQGKVVSGLECSDALLSF